MPLAIALCTMRNRNRQANSSLGAYRFFQATVDTWLSSRSCIYCLAETGNAKKLVCAKPACQARHEAAERYRAGSERCTTCQRKLGREDGFTTCRACSEKKNS